MEENIINIEKFYRECLSGCTIIYLFDGRKFFIGREVAYSLGFTNAIQAINNHVEENHRTTIGELEKNILNIRDIVPPGNSKHCSIILSEAGVYDLVFKSKNDNVKRFVRWVTERTLPALNIWL